MVGESHYSKHVQKQVEKDLSKKTKEEPKEHETGQKPTGYDYVMNTPEEVLQQEAYFTSILKSRGELSPEAALKFMDYISVTEDFGDEKNSNLQPVNLIALEYYIAKTQDISAEEYTATPDAYPQVESRLFEILENVRPLIYAAQTAAITSENQDEAAVRAQQLFLLNQCGVQPTEIEIQDTTAQMKTTLDALFSPDNTNIIALLEHCTTLDDPTTAQNLDALIDRIVGFDANIQIDTSPLPPDSPMESTEDGFILYANHATFKGKEFDQTLPLILQSALGLDGITQDYIAGLITPHKDIIGSKSSPSANTPNTPESNAAQDGGGVMAMIMAIMAAETKTQAVQDVYKIYEANQDDFLMQILGQFFTSKEGQGMGVGLVSTLFDLKSNIPSIVGTILETVMGFLAPALGGLGDLLGLSSADQKTGEYKNSANEITTADGGAPDTPPPKVANVPVQP
jgi:hypothetical protein